MALEKEVSDQTWDERLAAVELVLHDCYFPHFFLSFFLSLYDYFLNDTFFKFLVFLFTYLFTCSFPLHIWPCGIVVG
jgi:hypothetical protein